MVSFWLTLSAFNYRDYNRSLKTGIHVQGLGEALWGPLALLVVYAAFSWLSSLLDGGHSSAYVCCLLQVYTWPIHPCLTRLGDTFPDSWVLLSHPARQAILASFLILDLSAWISRPCSLFWCLLIKFESYLELSHLTLLGNTSKVRSKQPLATEWGSFPFLIGTVTLISSSDGVSITWLKWRQKTVSPSLRKRRKIK